jgi:hypothetical protein
VRLRLLGSAEDWHSFRVTRIESIGDFGHKKTVIVTFTSERSLFQALSLISAPNLKPARSLLKELEPLLLLAPGSKTKHQAWPGGWYDHTLDGINLGLLHYECLRATGRALPFSVSDFVLVFLLHDIEKPWKYWPAQLPHPEGGIPPIETKADRAAFRIALIERFRFVLTDQHWNAMKYVEGENEDYDPHARVMGPLAAFCHVCDVVSARLFYDYPLSVAEETFGPGRFNSNA